MATHITIIGPQRREFIELLQTLTQASPAHRLIHFATINAAIAAEPANLDDADLVIVLQSSSDQHERTAINALIGRTIFGRLLCCFGPWCESDGRTRDLWPDAVRVPIRLAAALIESELRDCEAGEDSTPVTAARDEVFGHRLRSDDARQTVQSNSKVTAAIIGPDRVLRRTVSQNLADMKIRSLDLPLIQAHPSQAVAAKKTSEGAVDLVIHDLDPWCPITENSLKAAQTMYPSATVWGIATMPDAGLSTEVADCNLQRVIPKLDMHLGLRWHIHQWSYAQQVVER